MTDLTTNLSPSLYEYFRKISLREPEVLVKLRAQTAPMSMSQMQISPEQGQFMALLIEMLGAKKTLDIGTFTGYSALVVALAMPPEGRVVACDINGEWTGIARRYWEMAGVSNKIDLRLAPAAETLQKLIDGGEEGTFDFAFIDADKKNYPIYYELALKLVRQGGVVAVDNVFYGGDVVDPNENGENVKAIRVLNEAILRDERVSISLVPISDGLMLARKR